MKIEVENKPSTHLTNQTADLGSDELSTADLHLIAGGVVAAEGADDCKATTDTSIGGCPG